MNRYRTNQQRAQDTFVSDLRAKVRSKESTIKELKELVTEIHQLNVLPENFSEKIKKYL